MMAIPERGVQNPGLLACSEPLLILSLDTMGGAMLRHRPPLATRRGIDDRRAILCGGSLASCELCGRWYFRSFQRLFSLDAEWWTNRRFRLNAGRTAKQGQHLVGLIASPRALSMRKTRVAEPAMSPEVPSKLLLQALRWGSGVTILQFTPGQRVQGLSRCTLSQTMACFTLAQKALNCSQMFHVMS